jgi:hypothetical protein
VVNDSALGALSQRILGAIVAGRCRLLDGPNGLALCTARHDRVPAVLECGIAREEQECQNYLHVITRV